MIVSQDHKLACKNMVSNQLATSLVSDQRILDAMSSVPREEFVPERLRKSAYMDEDMEVFEGRYLMEPLTFARMLQLAAIKSTDKVLVVGACTGYSVAVIEQLAGQVIAVESQRELADTARKALKHVKRNVEVFTSALAIGYPMFAPYDVILIEGAIRELPAVFADQLVEGGRIVTVLQKQKGIDAVQGLGEMVTYTNRQGVLDMVRHIECSVALLSEFDAKQEFQF